MCNFLRCCSIFIFGILLLFDVFAYSNPNPLKIYLCTKDINKPEFLVSERINASCIEKNNSYFLPLEGVTESGEKHQFGRHCFMVFARENGIVTTPDNTSRLNLTKVSSYGFGKQNGKTAAYSENLTNLPQNIAISCTALISEDDLSKEQVNEESILIKREISEEADIDDINALEASARLELMKELWNKVTRKMDLEKLVSYNLVSHNCCTVAYRAAAVLFDGNENKVKEKIDPTTYNIYGMGVNWDNYILSSSWTLCELSSDSFDSSSSSSSEVPSNEKKNVKKKDETRDDL